MWISVVARNRHDILLDMKEGEARSLGRKARAKKMTKKSIRKRAQGRARTLGEKIALISPLLEFDAGLAR